MRRIGPAKLGVLLVLSLLVGLNLVLPAGAHVTKRVPHLLKHLDPRYINVDEMAANANLLDGQDSTAFLGTNAKAADAELLDGQDSTSFMAGPGKVIDGAVAVSANNHADVLIEPGLFVVTYYCPAVLSNNGNVALQNLRSGFLDVFLDDGSDNPSYEQLISFDFVFPPTSAAGEGLMFQIHAPNGTATVHVMSVHRASECHVQAQAMISS